MCLKLSMRPVDILGQILYYKTIDCGKKCLIVHSLLNYSSVGCRLPKSVEKKMNSKKSYNKFKSFYEILLSVIGLSALYYWSGDIEVKIVLTIILLRVCYNWSELAELEKSIHHISHMLQKESQSESTTKESSGYVEPEIFSWAAFIGLLLQIIVTIGISIGIAYLIRML